MNYSHPDIAIQARVPSTTAVSSGLRKVFSSDPALTTLLLSSVPLVAGGVALHLNVVQWTLVGFVTLIFLMAGVFRRAALLQIERDSKISGFHASRIRWMGNGLVALTGGISLLTYLLIFVPKILPLF